jgi:hypothetical protein
VILHSGDPYWQTPEGRLRDPSTGRLKAELRAEAAARAAAEAPAARAAAEAHNARFEADQATKIVRAITDCAARRGEIDAAEAKPWSLEARKRQDELLEGCRGFAIDATMARAAFHTRMRDIGKRLTESKAHLALADRAFEMSQANARAIAGELDISRRIRHGRGEKARWVELQSAGITPHGVYGPLWPTNDPVGYRSVGRAMEAITAAIAEIDLLLDTERKRP